MDTAKALTSFNGALKEIGDASTETANQIAGDIVETAKRAGGEIDKTARRNPWVFVGAAAALAGVFGFFAGRKFKS
ncbi:MAG: hypothetical protein ACXVCK_01825 [Bdellovibrionota bacterium]